MNALLAWRPWTAAAIAAVLFLTNLGGARLWDDDEPKNARCGVEMHQSGEWVVPTFNNELRDHKPVLLYWTMRGSFAALGVSEFSARLPSALAGILIVVMCYHLGRLLFDQTTGFLAATLLASALMFAALARAATPDGVLMVATTAALLSFVGGVCARRGGRFSGGPDAAPLATFQLPLVHSIAMYIAMGVAVLAKGPIGVLLPLWAICLYGLFGEPAERPRREGESTGRWLLAWFGASITPRRWIAGAWSIRMPIGLLIVAAVAAPWYVAVSLKTGGDWLSGFLGTHNVGRFTSAMEGHSGPPVYYLVAVLAGFFPASCFLPAAVVGGVWRRSKEQPQARSFAFAMAVIFAWIGFFSLAATKLPNYVIPCYVGLAVLTAAWLVAQARRFAAADRPTIRCWLGAGMASSVLVGVTLSIALAVVGVLLLGSGPSIGLAGLFPLAGGAAGLWFLRTGAPSRAVAAFAACAVLFTLTGMTLVAPAASNFADGPLLAERVKRIEESLGRSTPFATHRYTTPSLVWELDRHVPGLDADATREFLQDPDAIVAMSREAYEELKPTLPPTVTALADQGRFMRRHHRVVLVGRERMLAHVPHRTLFR